MKKTIVIHGDIKIGDAEKLSKHFGIPLASTPEGFTDGPVLYLYNSKPHAQRFAKALSELGRDTRTLNLESALRQAERAKYGCAFESDYRRRLQGVAMAAVKTFSREIEAKVFKVAKRVSLLNGASEQQAAEKIVGAMLKVKVK